MPVFDWLKKNFESTKWKESVEKLDFIEWLANLEVPETPETARSTGPDTGANTAASGASRSHGQQKANDAEWVRPGTTVTIQGHEITAGMFYTGTRLQTKWGTADPSLVNPDLPARLHPESTQAGFSQSATNYSTMNEGFRSSYLHWMRLGRGSDYFSNSNLNLFVAGLERRVFVDIANDERLAFELPAIRSEVQRLLVLHESHRTAFYYYGDNLIRFIDILDYLIARSVPGLQIPPLPDPSLLRWSTPVTLEFALSLFAEAKLPVPAPWAFLWLWYLPMRNETVTEKRAPDEFRQLFELRYRERFGEGIKIRRSRTKLGISYSAINHGIGVITLNHPDFTGVFHLNGPIGQLMNLRYEVMTELGPYARFLGREPRAGGTLRGLANMPPVLLDPASPKVKKIRDWLEKGLKSSYLAGLSGEDVLKKWARTPPEKLSRAETTRFGALLWQLGYGLEPDIRLGAGPVIAPDAFYVLFRLGKSAKPEPSVRFTTAAIVCRLAALTMRADGDIVPEEMNALGEYLERAMKLDAAERIRLYATIAVLGKSEIKTTGLKPQVIAMPLAQRKAIGDLLAAIAAADGVVSPGEMKLLEKLFRLLDIDPKTIHGRIHAAMTGELAHPAAGPVTVRKASPGDPGVPVPARRGATPAPFFLDAQAIHNKMIETAEVSALLGDVFEDEPVPPVDVAEPVTDVGMIAGLDASHSTLLRQLAAQPEWTRDEFDRLVESLHLMPAGAMDTLNEVAFDMAEEPLLEGDTVLMVNSYALEALTQ